VDLHHLAIKHARHTTKKKVSKLTFFSLVVQDTPLINNESTKTFNSQIGYALFFLTSTA